MALSEPFNVGPEQGEVDRNGGLLIVSGNRAVTQLQLNVAYWHQYPTHAPASSVGGKVMPRAFAALRLITSSNSVGCPAARFPVFAATKALLCKTRLETLPNESIVRR
jgi:hypothetical protein